MILCKLFVPWLFTLPTSFALLRRGVGLIMALRSAARMGSWLRIFLGALLARSPKVDRPQLSALDFGTVLGSDCN
jgi:hypothetical protein